MRGHYCRLEILFIGKYIYGLLLHFCRVNYAPSSHQHTEIKVCKSACIRLKKK